MDGKGGFKALAKLHGIKSHENIRTWVNNYKIYGVDGLKVKRKNNSYSFDFKANVVKLYLTGEMSYQDLANQFKINNPALITTWVGNFRKYGLEGLKPKKRGRPSKMSTKKNKNPKEQSVKKEYTPEEIDRIKQLEEENYWLQMEVDILKKKIELRERKKQEMKKWLE